MPPAATNLSTEMAYLEYKPRETLYHYTNEDGFLGIIESRKLWLSDLYHSNDPRELNYGFEKITPIIYSKIPISQAEKTIYVRRLISKANRYLSRARIYSMSFSTEKDNINMWRTYANNGQGIMIGFRPRAIIDMPGRIQKPIYIIPDSTAEIETEIDNIISPLLYAKNISQLDDAFATETTADILTLSSKIKHYSWEYEKEVRLIFASPNKRGDDVGDLAIANTTGGPDVTWKEARSRQRGGDIIYFHEHSFGKELSGKNDPSEAIESITIGPNMRINHDEIKNLLSSNGFRNFSILSSDCRFR